MQNMDNLRKERISLFKNAVTAKEKNPRVPYQSTACCWITSDAGYNLSESCRNYEMSREASLYILKNYKIDAYNSLMGICNQQVLDSVGIDKYIYNDTTGGYSLKDHHYMEAEDYDELIKDPFKFIWTKILPESCPKLNGPDSVENFKNFIGEFNKFGAHVGGVFATAQTEYGIPSTFSSTPLSVKNGIEDLFCNWRGIKGLSNDMRRVPEKLEAALNAMFEEFSKKDVENYKKNATPGSDPEACYDAAIGALAHTIMNHKQFEKFYWPIFKIIGETLVEKDKIASIYFEGDSKRFWGLLRDLPERRFWIQSEMDDIFEMKKALPNLSVGGGMPLIKLGYQTAEECVDYAKKLIDNLAYDGRYIFSEQKMLTFKNDCRSENLKAVSDFIVGYKI